MTLWSTLRPRMAKPDDRDTKRMDVVLPPEAKQPVVRHFHYTTDQAQRQRRSRLHACPLCSPRTRRPPPRSLRRPPPAHMGNDSLMKPEI